MKVLKPVKITEAMIVSSTLINQEPTYRYNEFSTFVLDQLCGVLEPVTGVVFVYKSLQAGNIGNTPSTSPLWWVKVGETYAEYVSYLSTPLGSRRQVSSTHAVYECIVADGYARPVEPASTPTWLSLPDTSYVVPVLWVTATVYAVGDIRADRVYFPDPWGGPPTYNERIFRCLTAHTSSGSSIYFGNANWVTVTDLPQPFVAGRDYPVGAVLVASSTPGVPAPTYQALLTPNANVPFDNSPGWVKVGPTNYWAMFNGQVSEASVSADTLVETVAPGEIIDAIGLIGVIADSVEISVTDGPAGAVVYTNQAGLDGDIVTSWYEYFFYDPLNRQTQVSFSGLPPIGNPYVTITLHGVNVSLGESVVGRLYYLGETQYGLSGGIIDYSKKETDPEFGKTTFLERGYRSKLSCRIMLDNNQLNTVKRILVGLRATPCLWLSTDTPGYEEVGNVFGFYKDFNLEVPYFSKSYCSLELEGLT